MELEMTPCKQKSSSSAPYSNSMSMGGKNTCFEIPPKKTAPDASFPFASPTSPLFQPTRPSKKLMFQLVHWCSHTTLHHLGDGKDPNNCWWFQYFNTSSSNAFLEWHHPLIVHKVVAGKQHKNPKHPITYWVGVLFTPAFISPFWRFLGVPFTPILTFGMTGGWLG